MLLRRIVGLAVCLLLALAPCSRAAELSPQLEQALAALAPGKTLPVIVRMQDRPALPRLAGQGRAAMQQGRGALQQFRRELLQSLREQATTSQASLHERLQRAEAGPLRQLWLINGLAADVDRETLLAILLLPEVQSIDVDRVITLGTEPLVVTEAHPENNLVAVNAPRVWSAGYTGQGVTVANLDSGVSLQHPALAGTWRGGSNSWFDPYGVYPLPTDPNGHGTATMSLISSNAYDGQVLAVAPGARWIAARIFTDLGQAKESAIHQAFQWLLDPDGVPATDDAPDVVNLSWGGDELGTCDQRFETDLQLLKAAGIAVAIAAGNYGRESGSNDISPANNPSGFAVGMLEKTSPYLVDPASSRGPSSCDGSVFPELSAPGVDIAIAYGGGLKTATGTSLAAPHVAGAMALLRSALPDVTVDKLEQALTLTAVDLGQAGADNAYGYGMLDVMAALQLLSGFSLTPASHDFGRVVIGSAGPVQVFTVTNTKARDLAIDSVTTGGSSATDVTILDDNCSGRTLAAGGLCDFAVGFSPGAPGRREAVVQVRPATSGVPTLNIPLQGFGQSGIFAPAPGMTFTGGELTTLAWSSEPAARSYKLKFSRNGGWSWSLLGIVDAPAGSLVWQVPHLARVKAGCLIKLVAFAGPAGTGERLAVSSTGPFTIRPQAVALTAPNGGEMLAAGQQVAVTWTPASKADRYELFLSPDNGGSWQQLAVIQDSTGYLWTVPSMTAGTGAARLKVKAYAKQTKLGADETDGVFAIAPAMLPASGSMAAR